MLGEFGHASFLLIVGLIFPAGAIVTSWLFGRLHLRPSIYNAVKSETYECGVPSEGTAWVQFNFRYYLFALIFLVFDVEVLFLFPWAAAFDSLGTQGFVAATIFIGILLIGFVYDWAKGALEWVK
jgi:NADH:ubiquinone oxidoreductase subunit 3 (subunit A)